VFEALETRMRWRRIGAAAGLLLLLGSAAVVTPRVVRKVAQSNVFRVSELELKGARYLTLEEATASAAVPPGASVWDDPSEWEARLESHPLVREARVRRRIPGTLVFDVQEREPVGLVPTPTLEVVDAEGRILPIDPSEHALDLPLLRVSSGARETDKLRAELAAEVERLARVSPEFAGMVSELSTDERGDLLARWGEPAVTFRFTPAVTARKLREGVLVLLEITRETGEAPETVDLRFEEQVVVRRAQ
jgi:cell division protein FtsQ